jgi:hypothetical protein
MLAERRARLALLRRRDVPKASHHFAGFLDLGQMLLTQFSILERDAPEMFAATRYCAHGQTGILAMGAMPRGETIDLPCENRRTVVQATGPTSSTHATAWVGGWYAAVMARDTECLDLLSAVPDEALRSSSTQTDDYHYAWKAALITFRRKPDDAVRLAEEAIRLTQRDNLRIAGAETAALGAATFRILQALGRGEVDGFQDALADALIAQRDFYSKIDPFGRDPMGFIAWGPLAMACLAHDSGMPIHVDSEYLLPPIIHWQHPDKES